jgi:hypothetical protein
MIHNREAERWSISHINQKLTEFYDMKEEEVTTIVYHDYKVIKEIARGALGIVYLAEGPNK